MNVVCLGQQNWDVCWTGKQQLMSRLAERGHRVLYLDPDADPAAPPPGLAGLRGRASAYAPAATGRGLREVRPGLFVYTHRDPAGRVGGPLARRARARHRRRTVEAVAARLGVLAPVVLALRPGRAWVCETLRPAARVYYAVDEWTAFSGLTDDARRNLRLAEERELAECDLALAVSPRLAERFRLIRPRTHLLENGADVGHFGPDRLARATPHPAIARLLEESDGPVLGYVGQVDERLDAPLIAALADARPAWRFALAGRVKAGYDASLLADRPNVHLLGYVPYDDLPGVVRGFDACLAPYARSPLTDSCNPLKVFEYLATGKPTVATPVEGLRACRGAAALAEGPGEWLAAIDAALADPAAGRADRLAVAAANTWDARADALESHLREAVGAAKSAKLSARRSRGWSAGRRVGRAAVRLDPKDESVLRSHRGWGATSKFGPGQRAALAASRLGGWAYYAGRLAWRVARGERPATVRDILVVRRGYLGDLVAALPMLEAIRRRYPQARVVLGVQPGGGASTALAGVGAGGPVDEVRVLDFVNAHRRRDRLRGMAGLFGEGFDLVVSGVSYFMMPEATFAGSPRRVGLYDGHPRQQRLDRAVPIDPTLHEAENNLALAEALGASAEGVQRVPRPRLDEAAVDAEADKTWAALGLPPGASVVTMHPGSKRPTRRWPAERFADLAGRLLVARPDLHVVLTGVPDEAELVEEVLSQIPAAVRGRAHGGAGKSSLLGLVGLLDRSAAAVTNDTGTMHVARSRGVPLVAVIGPENDRRWGPHPLGPGPATVVKGDVPCAPCIRWDCPALYCLRSVSVESVAAEVGALLDRPAGRSVSLPVAGAPRRGWDDGTAGYLPVGRRVARRSWRDLAADGFVLPRVTVVLFAPGVAWEPRHGPNSDRGTAGGRDDRVAADQRAAVGGGLRPVGPQLPRPRRADGHYVPASTDPTAAPSGVDWAAALAGVARQDYPAVDAVVVAPDRVGIGDFGAGAARVARFDPAGGPAAAWAAALSAAGGDYLLPTSPAAAAGFAEGKVGGDVAGAFRAHAAEAADGPRALDAWDLHAAALGPKAYRAAFRAERLAAGGSAEEPLPEPRAVDFGRVTFDRAALARTVAQRFGPAAVPAPAAATMVPPSTPAAPSPTAPSPTAPSHGSAVPGRPVPIAS